MAAQDDSTPTITVRGQAALRAEPDEALVWITLTALHEDPGQALSDVSRRSDALIALLDALGVAKADRSTTGVTVFEEFDHIRGARQPRGHRATASVSARLTEPEAIGRLIARATAELQARIDGPRWQIAADNPVRLEAARAAAAHAQRKAQAYAGGVGAKLGRLVKLAEPDAAFAGPHFHRVSSAVPASAAEGMPIEPGEHEVDAAVDVTFALDLPT